METVLISLKQSHNVFIRNADFTTISEYGLVAPPLYMMKRYRLFLIANIFNVQEFNSSHIFRISQESMMKWKHVMEEKVKDDKIIDRWDIYIDICRVCIFECSMFQNNLNTTITIQKTSSLVRTFHKIKNCRPDNQDSTNVLHNLP